LYWLRRLSDNSNNQGYCEDEDIEKMNNEDYWLRRLRSSRQTRLADKMAAQQLTNKAVQGCEAANKQGCAAADKQGYAAADKQGYAAADKQGFAAASNQDCAAANRKQKYANQPEAASSCCSCLFC
jgi:hypothetical protein